MGASNDVLGYTDVPRPACCEGMQSGQGGWVLRDCLAAHLLVLCRAEAALGPCRSICYLRSESILHGQATVARTWNTHHTLPKGVVVKWGAAGHTRFARRVVRSVLAIQHCAGSPWTLTFGCFCCS